MRTQRIVLSLACAFGAGAGAIAPASSEEQRGTWEQRMACTPDVWRLCSGQIPDVNRIVTCLRQNTPQLSNSCRAVFDSQASAQPQPAARVPQQQTAPGARAPQPPPQALRPRALQAPQSYEEDE